MTVAQAPAAFAPVAPAPKPVSGRAQAKPHVQLAVPQPAPRKHRRASTPGSASVVATPAPHISPSASHDRATASAPAPISPSAPSAPEAPLGLGAATGAGSGLLAAGMFAVLISLIVLARPRVGRRVRLAIDLLVVPPGLSPLEHPG